MLPLLKQFPSWPDLFRPSAPFFQPKAAKQDVDARDKRGHDEFEIFRS
jgi:hypothetical protein